MNQIAMQVDVNPSEVMRKRDFGGAIELTLELGGKTAKEAQIDLGLDKAQYSRWQSGDEGVRVPKLFALMTTAATTCRCCGWPTHAAGTCTPCAGWRPRWSAKTACCAKKTPPCAAC